MSMYDKNHYNIVVISLQLIKINGEEKKKETYVILIHSIN